MDVSFASRKQVDAGLLNVGYAEDKPPGGQPVILLHGWPYDIHSYVDVAPALAQKGYRRYRLTVGEISAARQGTHRALRLSVIGTAGPCRKCDSSDQFLHHM